MKNYFRILRKILQDINTHVSENNFRQFQDVFYSQTENALLQGYTRYFHCNM